MDQKLAAVYEKLLKLREKKDLTIKPSSHLKKEITLDNGSVIPFKLRYYQIQMVYHLLCMNRFVVGDDTGLGKTIEAIASCAYIWDVQPQTKVLVLTKKSAVPQWASEFERFTNGVGVFICIGTPKQRAKIREAFENHEGPCVLVAGYATARSDIRHIQKWENFIFIPDEAHVFKNPKSQIHQVGAHLSKKAAKTWALTATCLKNNLVEGYGVFEVVVPGLFGLTKSGFEKRFALTELKPTRNGRKVQVVIGHLDIHIQEFKKIISPYFLGRPKHAVADELPVLTIRKKSVKLTPYQLMKYNEALGDILETGSGEKEMTPLTAVTYCQEIVNHPQLIDCEGDSGKLHALAELLGPEGEFSEDKVIIFTRFERMVTIAMEYLQKKKIKCVRVTGKESELDREEAKKQFQDFKSDVKVIFITTAGGDSINLQSASALIFYDTPWSAGDYIQILGRMIRIGSVHDKVYAIHLIAPSTIDDKVFNVCKKKLKLIEKVIGERILGDKENKNQIPMLEVENDFKKLFEGLVSDAKEQKGS